MPLAGYPGDQDGVPGLRPQGTRKQGGCVFLYFLGLVPHWVLPLPLPKAGSGDSRELPGYGPPGQWDGAVSTLTEALVSEFQDLEGGSHISWGQRPALEWEVSLNILCIAKPRRGSGEGHWEA